MDESMDIVRTYVEGDLGVYDDWSIDQDLHKSDDQFRRFMSRMHAVPDVVRDRSETRSAGCDAYQTEYRLIPYISFTGPRATYVALQERDRNGHTHVILFVKSPTGWPGDPIYDLPSEVHWVDGRPRSMAWYKGGRPHNITLCDDNGVRVEFSKIEFLENKKVVLHTAEQLMRQYGL